MILSPHLENGLRRLQEIASICHWARCGTNSWDSRRVWGDWVHFDLVQTQECWVHYSNQDARTKEATWMIYQCGDQTDQHFEMHHVHCVIKKSVVVQSYRNA